MKRNVLLIAVVVVLGILACKGKKPVAATQEAQAPQAKPYAQTPEQAVSMFYDARIAKDGAAMWELGCNEDKQKVPEGIAQDPELAQKLGMTQEELAAAEPRTIFIKMVSTMPDEAIQKPSNTKTETVSETRAKVIYRKGDLLCEVDTCKDPEGWKYDGERCEGGG